MAKKESYPGSKIIDAPWPCQGENNGVPVPANERRIPPPKGVPNYERRGGPGASPFKGRKG